MVEMFKLWTIFNFVIILLFLLVIDWLLLLFSLVISVSDLFINTHRKIFASSIFPFRFSS
eukprot:UN17039